MTGFDWFFRYKQTAAQQQAEADDSLAKDPEAPQLNLSVMRTAISANTQTSTLEEARANLKEAALSVPEANRALSSEELRGKKEKSSCCVEGRTNMKVMKTTGIGIIPVIAIIALAGLAHAAEAPPPQFPGPYPVELTIGEIFRVCNTGEIICPVVYRICDDPKVVEIVDTSDGLGFRGIAPGTTLCAARGAEGPRRVFRITVR